jgi:hypothetical protein
MCWKIVTIMFNQLYPLFTYCYIQIWPDLDSFLDLDQNPEIFTESGYRSDLILNFKAVEKHGRKVFLLKHFH